MIKLTFSSHLTRTFTAVMKINDGQIFGDAVLHGHHVIHEILCTS
jgi:hypothetical protein